MDFFIEQGFSANVLGTLNRCRLYLQVLTLSDIVSADGLCIVPDVFIGIPLSDRKSTLRWPCQQRPCSKSWAIWKTALQILQPRNKLLAPLGAWLSAESHQTWFWYKDSILPKLYRRDPSSTQCTVIQGFMNPRWTTRASPVLVFDADRGQPVIGLPVNSVPASIQLDHTGVMSAVSGPPLLTISTTPSPRVTVYQLLCEHSYFQSLFLASATPSEADIANLVNELPNGVSNYYS